jgi:hypothetical protein
MCMVSNVGDYANQWLPNQYPYTTLLGQTVNPYVPEVSKEEFAKLKKEIELLRDVLVKAKIYDEETGQPDCEMEDKVKYLKKIAEWVGVELPL